MSRDTCDACDSVDRCFVSWLSDSMRSIFFVLALTTACATTHTNTVNVAAVRHEINDTINDQHGDRSIYSMGKVTADHAIVYTEGKDGSKQEENWSKTDGTWRQENATKLSGTPQAEGN